MKKTVTISSAELMNINSVPKVLVAAPGANKVIVPSSIMISTAYGGAAYTNVLGTAILLGTDKATGQSLVAYSATLFTSAANRGSMTPPVLSTVDNLTVFANQPLILTASTNFALGNGTAKVFVTYEITDV